MSQKYVIFDLDGCLSDDRHRIHLLPAQRTPDYGDAWAAYHQLAAFDPPMNRELVEHHREQGHRIIIITARPAEYGGMTAEWLLRNFDSFSRDEIYTNLFMRPKGNLLPSPQLKVYLTKMWVSMVPENIVAIYDDRADVLDAFGEFGIHRDQLHLTTYPEVAEGPVEPEVKDWTPLDCLEEGAALFRSRNAEYKDNYVVFGDVMHALYPDGITVRGAEAFVQLGLLVQMLGKFTRHAAAPSDKGHLDSVRDLKVYSAMLESRLRRCSR